MNESDLISRQLNQVPALIETIYKKYGYDFSDYSIDSFQRRLNSFMIRFAIQNLDELQKKISQDDLFFNTFLEEITVNVTEFFRDPDFFKTLRDEVLPKLSVHPLIRIWHAGCSTGEEVYSLAIILKELDLLDRSLLYATDINQRVLEKASSRKFAVEQLEHLEKSYANSGGIRKLADYYTTDSGTILFSDELRNRMVFSPHNLVADKSFNEFNLILCRNVLIYFNHNLQNRVVQLFSESLSTGGFLALGSKEGIDFTHFRNQFEAFDRRQRIWSLIQIRN